MQTIDQMIADIIRREGGYNDVPGDAGGATNAGISLRYLRGKGILTGDLDHDGDVDEKDVQLITPAIAAKLYKEDFYYAPGLGVLPAELQPFVFDFGVNAGPETAIEELQRVLNRMLQRTPIDGRLGPNTLAMCKEALRKYGVRLMLNTLVEGRKKFYNDLVERKPNQRKFLRGWLNRADEFRVTK